jgi:hypothetical protein
VRIEVLVALNQIDVSFSVETIFEQADDVGRPRESENPFLVLSVLYMIGKSQTQFRENLGEKSS